MRQIKSIGKKGERCCFCGDKNIGWGNNPEPLYKDGVNRCCDDCNAKIVIPERMRRMKKYGRW